MKLYIARHGQTDMNAQNLICGMSDVPLNQAGMRQASELAEKVASSCTIDIIIASPMLRAQQTAAVISNRTGVPVETDARITEQNYGIFEGQLRTTKEFLALKREPFIRFPGGESPVETAHRVYSLIDDVQKNRSGQNILFVCHGGIYRVFHTYFNDMSVDEYYSFHAANCQIECYEIISDKPVTPHSGLKL